jgi:hypothetical protein
VFCDLLHRVTLSNFLQLTDLITTSANISDRSSCIAGDGRCKEACCVIDCNATMQAVLEYRVWYLGFWSSYYVHSRLSQLYEFHGACEDASLHNHGEMPTDLH